MSKAFSIYGADGQPIMVQVPGDGDHAVAQIRDIGKRVRSRAVSMTALQDRDRGKQKPTPVTWDTLRLMAARNEWVRAIVNRRKRQITGVKFDVTLKDTDDPSGAARRAAKSLVKLFEHPMAAGSRPQSTHWQQWLGMLLEDLYVLDRPVVEKEWDGNGWIKALYNVDGATVRPNLDDRGGFYDDAYVQVVDGIKEATFGLEDMIVGIYNPSTDVKLAGYGFSPLETLIVSVTADLHAAKYNSDYFVKGAVPEGVLDLGEDVDPEQVDAFRLFWASEITGKPWSLPIIGGSKGPQFVNWRDNNRDMQFMEYQSWLLQKMCAVFEIDQKDLGQIEDVNRSTAESADSSNERVGITPVLDFLKHLFDLEVIGQHGCGLGDYLEFSWDQVGESAEAINAKFQPLVSSGAASRKEWREAHGLDDVAGDEVGAEGLTMHLSDGTPQPLPSAKDVAVMGAHAQLQQQQEAQQQDMEHQNMQAERDQQAAGEQDGGEAAQTPWQPADPDHPAVQQAMADHDQEQGIGPRNVGKTHPLGHDRHPALTHREDDLAAVFEHATHDLIAGLADVMASA